MEVCFEKLSDRGEVRPKSCTVAQSTTGRSTCPSYLSCACFLGTLRSLSGCTNTKTLTADKKVGK